MSPTLIVVQLAMLVAMLLPASLQGAPVLPTMAAYFAFLPAADRQPLFSRGELTASGARIADLPLGSKAPFAKLLAQEFTTPATNIAHEGFYLFPKPSGSGDVALYNALNAVDTMAGLQYYSVSKQSMQTLILASYRVDEANPARRLADPVFNVIPAYQRAVVFQQDNRLGDGMSELIYQSAPNRVSLSVRNLQALHYGFLPLVAPRNMEMLFVVIPLDDRIAVYAALQAKTAHIWGLQRTSEESFRNRMRALAGWVGARIATVGHVKNSR